jgi:hypothetical protein
MPRHNRVIVVLLRYAAAPQLEQLSAGGRLGDQRRQVVFARRVEAVVHARDDLTEQAVGADDVRPVAGHAVVDHQQMVADRIIAVDVAAAGDHRRRRRRAHLVIEDLVAQPDIELPRPVHVRRIGEHVGRHRRCLLHRETHRRIPAAVPIPGLYRSIVTV